MAAPRESDYGHSLPLHGLTHADIASLAKFSGGEYHPAKDAEAPHEIHFVDPEGSAPSKIVFSSDNVSLHEPHCDKPKDLTRYDVIPFEERLVIVSPDHEEVIYAQEGKIMHQ